MKRQIAIVVIISLLIQCFPSYAKGYEKVDGLVNCPGSNVNVRTGPGTSYGVLKKDGANVVLSHGTSIKVIGEKKATDGELWYQIQFNYKSYVSLEGYMIAKYVTKVSVDDDFEAYLTAQGFPESYKSYLRALHTKYPKWKFVAQHTNLQWKTVIDKESKLGVNLVQSNSLDSWKSMETGAFDWLNNKWIGFDSSSWVAASREIIEYFIDPRTQLDEVSIFQFEQLKLQPFHTVEGIQKILNNTFMKGTYDNTGKTYAETFMEAAKKTGASPYMLASRCRMEMGVNGTSQIISGNVSGYVGYYNYFNIGAYNNSSGTAVQNGLKYAKGTDAATLRPWNSRYKAIVGGSMFIANQYINRGQDTVYLQKFNVQGSNPYTHQYQTAVHAPNSEAKSIKSAHNNDLNKEIVFKIPVYLNMPSKVSVKPTATGNPNYLLKSLSIDGQKLTPKFDPFVSEYNVVVDEEVSTINLKATSIDKDATISGIGSKKLAFGENTITVKVKAENGTKKDYIVNVYRNGEDDSESETTPTPSEKVTSSIYDIGSYVTGINPGTKASTVAANIKSNQGSISILDASGKVNNGIVKTGDTVKTKTKKIPIVIYGDITGDGKITTLDLLYLQRHLLEVKKLNSVYLQAADTNRKKDGVSTLDLLYLQRHLLDVKHIVQ